MIVYIIEIYFYRYDKNKYIFNDMNSKLIFNTTESFK